MTVNELRIGNQLFQSGKIAIISNISTSIDDWDRINNKRLLDCKPIPLTEEFLLKFGFQKFCSEWILSTKETSFIIEREDDRFYYTGGEGCKLSRYFDKVHELQNLCFALTGTELNPL